MFKEFILATLLSLPSYPGDKNISANNRQAMLEPVAEAISREVKDQQEAVVLIVDGYFKSKYASNILHGRCQLMPPRERCENGRARGPFMVHGSCRDAFVGRDGGFLQLLAATECSLSTYRKGLRKCRSLEGGVAVLAGYSSCSQSMNDEMKLFLEILNSWGISQ